LTKKWEIWEWVGILVFKKFGKIWPENKKKEGIVSKWSVGG